MADANKSSSDQTSALPNDIRESIAISSLDSVAGQPSMLSNLAFSNALDNINNSQQNTVANQQSLNQIGLSVLGKAANLISNLTPMEAVAVIKLDTGNDIAEQISDLKAATSSLTASSSNIRHVNIPAFHRDNGVLKATLGQEHLPAQIYVTGKNGTREIIIQKEE